MAESKRLGPPKMSDVLAGMSAYIPGVPRPAPKFVTEDGRPVHGIIAEFATTPDVYHAAEAIRDEGYTRWDVYSPFPVHGIDGAMGIRRTRLPLLCGLIGFTGAGLGYLLQHWISGVDYQIVVQGKPYASWQPFVPVTFELGILFCAFTCLLGMLAMNGLPRWNHPVFSSERFLKTSDDRLMICIEATDDRFDPLKTKALLEKLGGTEIDLIEDED